MNLDTHEKSSEIPKRSIIESLLRNRVILTLILIGLSLSAKPEENPFYLFEPFYKGQLAVAMDSAGAPEDNGEFFDLRDFGTTLSEDEIGYLKLDLGIGNVNAIFQHAYSEKYFPQKAVLLSDCVSAEVKEDMQKFDPELFKKLDKIVIRQGSSWDSNGLFMGMVDMDEDGFTTFNPAGEYYLVAVGRDQLKSFKLTALLIHEVYGHAFDGNTGVKISSDYTQSYKQAFNDIDRLCLNLYHALHSEFRAFYLSTAFIYQQIEQNTKLGKIYKKHFYIMSEFSSDDMLFRLYELFKDSIKSKDWSDFKKEILKHYLHNEHLVCRLIQDPSKLQATIQLSEDGGSFKSTDEIFKTFFVDLLTPDHPL